MVRKPRQAAIEITPEMIAAADQWLLDNRDMIDEGGSGNLEDLGPVIN